MSVEPIDIDSPDVDGDLAGRVTYRGELFTGEAVEYGPQGQLVSITTYTDGIQDGPQKDWYPDGSPESEGVAKYGRAVGVWRGWFPGGRLNYIDRFDDGGNLVYRRIWDENGALIEEYPVTTHDIT